jgi:hypothetical protein
VNPQLSSWLPSLVAVPLVGFMLYRRLRRTFGRQPVAPRRMALRMDWVGGHSALPRTSCGTALHPLRTRDASSVRSLAICGTAAESADPRPLLPLERVLRQLLCRRPQEGGSARRAVPVVATSVTVPARSRCLLCCAEVAFGQGASPGHRRHGWHSLRRGARVGSAHSRPVPSLDASASHYGGPCIVQ